MIPTDTTGGISTYRASIGRTHPRRAEPCLTACRISGRRRGYRTAKDFAEAVDIPAPTYTRYEQEPAKIPIERAWIIADFLGCTIDAVVGRTPIKPSEMRGPVQRVYDALSDKNKGLLDDYLDYIQYKDGKEQARDRAQDQRRYEELVQQYSRQFYESMGSGEADFIDLVSLGDADALRARFLEFVETRLADERDREIADALDMAESVGRRNARDNGWEFEVAGERFLIRDTKPKEPLSIELACYKLSNMLSAQYEERDREVLEGITSAYDGMRRRRNAFPHALGGSFGNNRG